MWQLPPLKSDEILIYLRKSRSDDPLLSVEEVLSKHEQMIDEWVQRMLPDCGRIPEENRLREVVSGETIDSRPQMRALLRRIESDSYKAVLVYEPSRLSRGDLEDIGRLTKLLRYTKTIVISLKYSYDLNDDRDRDDFERELKRGNEFLEYQKRIMYNGRLLSVQNGNFIGQRAPYGYRKVQLKEGKKKIYTLEPHPEEAAVVRLIYQLYLEGLGSTRINDRLLELGFKPPAGKQWTSSSLYAILTNEHYIGMVRWERKKTIKTVENGDVKAHRPVSNKYIVVPGKHPPIIDKETFEAVRAKKGLIPRNKKATNFTNPFAGLIYCECGESVARHTFVVRGVERAEPRYQCRNQRQCGNASCRSSELMAEVKRMLAAAVADFEVKIEASDNGSTDLQHELIKRLERRLVELETLELSQWEKYTMEAMPKHIFEQLNAKVLRDKEDTIRGINTAKNSIREPQELRERITTFRTILKLIDNPDVSARDLNDLLKACIERITYRRPNTPTTNSRWGTGAPMQLDIKLRI